MLAVILICAFMVKNAATRMAHTSILKKNCLSSEHVIVIISIVVVGLGQTKDYKIDTCCLSPNYKHMTFKSKHKHWLDLSLNNAYRQ
jgi:hypothetical protein